MEKDSSTLVCSAIDGEIDLITNSKKFEYVKSLGIGNLEAALSLQVVLSKNPSIQNVVFFGSCGVYPWANHQTGDMVSAGRTYHLELSASLGQSKQIQNGKSFIDFERPNLKFKPALNNAPTTLTLKDLDSPPSKEWQEIDVENLELYGVARVCEIFQLSLSAHMIITNIVGSLGSASWQKNWRNFSNHLQTAYLNS